MRVIGLEILAIFGDKLPGCRAWLASWLADMRGMQLPSPSAIKQRYVTATLDDDRIIVFTFHLEGIQYFMKVQVAENAGVLVIKWIGSTVDYMTYKSEVSHGN
jgi:mRNA-degrading endonuclease HigB of HigAB toxin-antitoxin module